MNHHFCNFAKKNPILRRILFIELLFEFSFISKEFQQNSNKKNQRMWNILKVKIQYDVPAGTIHVKITRNHHLFVRKELFTFFSTKATRNLNQVGEATSHSYVVFEICIWWTTGSFWKCHGKWFLVTLAILCLDLYDHYDEYNKMKAMSFWQYILDESSN